MQAETCNSGRPLPVFGNALTRVGCAFFTSVDLSGAALDPVGFVLVLAASQHMFVRLTLVMNQAEWVGAHVGAAEFFGGLPRRLVPDNLTGLPSGDITRFHLRHSELRITKEIGPPRLRPKRTPPISSSSSRSIFIRGPRPYPNRRRTEPLDHSRKFCHMLGAMTLTPTVLLAMLGDGPYWHSALEILGPPKGVSFYRDFNYREQWVEDDLLSKMSDSGDSFTGTGIVGLRFKNDDGRGAETRFIPLREAQLTLRREGDVGAALILGQYIKRLLRVSCG